MATYQDAYLNMPENIGREVPSGTSPAGSRELNITPVSQIRAEQDAARKRYVEDEIKDAANIYANKMGVNFDEARALMQAKYDNQRKMASFQVQQQTRDLEAQNTHIDALRELTTINPADPKSVDQYDAIAKKYTPAIAGTSYFKDFTNSLTSQRNEAIKYAQSLRAEKTQERLTKAEEQKAFYESPEQVEKRAIIATTAAEQAKEKFAKFKAETPEEKQKEQQRMATLKRQGLSAINQIDQQIKAELSTFPGNISLPQLEMAKPVDEKGRPVKSMDEATNFLVTTYVGNKEKKTVVPRASVIGAIQTIRGLEQQKQAARDELKAYGISESDEEPTAPAEAPAGMTQTQPSETQAPSDSVAPTTQYSSDNPYAAQATAIEAQQQKARTETERKALRRQLAPKIQDAQARIVRAQEAIKDPTILLPSAVSLDGAVIEIAITDQDKAKAFETAKKELADAQAEYSALLDKYPVTSTENDATTSAAPSATPVPLGAIFK